MHPTRKNLSNLRHASLRESHSLNVLQRCKRYQIFTLRHDTENASPSSVQVLFGQIADASLDYFPRKDDAGIPQLFFSPSAVRIALSYAPASGKFVGELNAICTCWIVVILTGSASIDLGTPRPCEA